MKNLVVLLVIAGLVYSSTLTNANNSKSNFRAYEISEVSDLNVGKKVQAIWTLKYNNQEVPVTVMKRKVLDGAEYIVSSKFFEVSYAATSNGFGAKTVRKSWSNVPKEITNAVISETELNKQSVITPNKVNDNKALALIASYLPELMNKGYEHVLN